MLFCKHKLLFQLMNWSCSIQEYVLLWQLFYNYYFTAMCVLLTFTAHTTSIEVRVSVFCYIFNLQASYTAVHSWPLVMIRVVSQYFYTITHKLFRITAVYCAITVTTWQVIILNFQLINNSISQVYRIQYARFLLAIRVVAHIALHSLPWK